MGINTSECKSCARKGEIQRARVRVSGTRMCTNASTCCSASDHATVELFASVVLFAV